MLQSPRELISRGSLDIISLSTLSGRLCSPSGRLHSSMAHSCESSRARGGRDVGSLLPGGLPYGTQRRAPNATHEKGERSTSTTQDKTTHANGEPRTATDATNGAPRETNKQARAAHDTTGSPTSLTALCDAISNIATLRFEHSATSGPSSAQCLRPRQRQSHPSSLQQPETGSCASTNLLVKHCRLHELLLVPTFRCREHSWRRYLFSVSVLAVLPSHPCIRDLFVLLVC